MKPETEVSDFVIWNASPPLGLITKIWFLSSTRG